jgi:hypothetical protein
MRARRSGADEVLALRRTGAKKIGDARRISEAALRSAWDKYEGAIEAAHAGKVNRLVDCLRGRKPMTDDDRDRLASYCARKIRRRLWPPKLVRALSRPLIENDYDLLADLVEAVGRRPGGVLDEPVHRAVRLAEVLLSLLPNRAPAAMRTALIEYACEVEGAESGVVIDPDRVCDRLNRPKTRRHRY